MAQVPLYYGTAPAHPRRLRAVLGRLRWGGAGVLGTGAERAGRPDSELHSGNKGARGPTGPKPGAWVGAPVSPSLTVGITSSPIWSEIMRGLVRRRLEGCGLGRGMLKPGGDDIRPGVLQVTAPMIGPILPR